MGLESTSYRNLRYGILHCLCNMYVLNRNAEIAIKIEIIYIDDGAYPNFNTRKDIGKFRTNRILIPNWYALILPLALMIVIIGLDNTSIKIYISVNFVKIIVYRGKSCSHNLRMNDVSQRMGKDKRNIR